MVNPNIFGFGINVNNMIDDAALRSDAKTKRLEDKKDR